ncbi:pyridoxamine 5'-phosphate oxidase family protein [Pseudonocardia sp. MH-G8]|uniref:pyridoxamine 5'-phosphate oxidase family protein n=1 Tax=Pseudonocardia sp. MH-G8 TaxID=1854588 RepID=UPI000BA096CA|nr:pyridoxamine 5'-phosphate oxidase family protein [Pseudonocardia sp. MH-G8]OZM80359.1 phosphate oxidase [Pseudonocardia sp. MH-G8]
MDFDVDAFLAQPLTARVATPTPTVRPTWFLWEDGAFWILTGPWARLRDHVRADPRLAVVVDTCDLTSGSVRQVIACGRGQIVEFDVARGRRKLVRYLGHDVERWDPRFRAYLFDDPRDRGLEWVRMRPDRMTASDLSYEPAPERRE